MARASFRRPTAWTQSPRNSCSSARRDSASASRELASAPARRSNSKARSAAATASSSLPARRSSSTCFDSRSRSSGWFCSDSENLGDLAINQGVSKSSSETSP